MEWSNSVRRPAAGHVTLPFFYITHQGNSHIVCNFVLDGSVWVWQLKSQHLIEYDNIQFKKKIWGRSFSVWEVCMVYGVELLSNNDGCWLVIEWIWKCWDGHSCRRRTNFMASNTLSSDFSKFCSRKIIRLRYFLSHQQHFSKTW